MTLTDDPTMLNELGNEQQSSALGNPQSSIDSSLDTF